MAEKLEIFCDEAGHTGPHLLNPQQKIFSFASVAVSDAEASEIIKKVREKFPIQMPELKAFKLLKSKRGRALVRAIIQELDGRYALVAHDKLLALCGWVFEYIFEPVFHKHEPLLKLLYAKKFHHFVAMYTYLWFQEKGSAAEKAVCQFQDYIRNLDETKAPLLFEAVDIEAEHPFAMVLKFAKGYRDIIIEDNRQLDQDLPDEGKWALDLSASGLWSHLNFWGRNKKPLRVVCDHSKPLQAVAEYLVGTTNDPGIRRAQDILGKTDPFGWNLAEPITFSDSQEHSALQLADVIAGTFTSIASNGYEGDFEDVAHMLEKHLLADCIFPDFEVLDLQQRIPAVNWLILFHLSSKAAANESPYKNLAEMYHVAEVSWAKGDFRPPISNN